MFLSALSAIQSLDCLSWHISSILLLALSATLTWRIWSFTIKPALYPTHPKELPYWIPWLGHAPEFVSDGHSLIRRARLYFRNTREPFFLTVGGTRLYILTSAGDVSHIYRDTETFTFDKAVADFTHQYGVSKETCKAVYERPASREEDPARIAGFDNPGLKALAHLNSDYIKLQLHPGAQFDELASKFAVLMHEWTAPEYLTGDMVQSMSSDGHEKTISFYKWSQLVLLQTTSRAIFGPELLEQSPTLFSDFLIFDDESWRLWYKMPGSQHIVDAKNRVIDAIEKFISIPRDERLDMAPFIDFYERTERAYKIPQREIATILSMLYSVTNTNTFKLSFWIMAHLLHHPDALEQVTSEIRPAFDPQEDEVRYKYLTDSCPFFNAVFDETLRIYSANSSLRTTTKPAVINGKHIPANAEILCPFRELHWDTDVWGQDPSIWNPSRFLKSNTLNRSTSYRPFGGGLSYCPGRFIARTEALLFIALILHRYDVRLEPGQRLPRYDPKPNPALMGPVSGDDLLLVVKAKQ